MEEANVKLISQMREMQENIKKLQEENEKLWGLSKKDRIKVIELEKENTKLMSKIEYLTKKIENMKKWCQLIADIGFDYDGYNSVYGLKSLVNELVKYSLYARDNDDYDDFLNKGENDE